MSAVRDELHRQVERLLEEGYPDLAGLGEPEFLAHVSRLEERLPEVPAETPFAVVVSHDLVPPHEAVERIVLDGKRGFTRMEPAELERFDPIAGVEVPADPVYLVTGLDTGAATLDVTPDDALETILGQRRSPLTIHEGLAFVTHHPDVLRTLNCFSLLGSRCGDRRVTALWISGGRPRLGWCWAGNPHTWLGSASCASRLAPPV